MLLLKEKVEEMVQERVTLRQEQEELRGDNKRLFGQLERRKAAEVPAAAKCRNLEARLEVADTGVLKEGVARLVALEQELLEKAAQLARQRHWKRLGTLLPQT